MGHVAENLSSGFPTRSNTKRAVQLQKMLEISDLGSRENIVSM